MAARYGYDAAGRRAQTTQTTSRMSLTGSTILTTALTQTDVYDGDGVGVKHTAVRQLNGGSTSTEVMYFLRSSVLGGRTISEYNSAGARQTSYAWAGGEVVAQQVFADDATFSTLRWEHLNPVTGDGRETDTTGKVKKATHLDPSGVDVGEADPFGGAASDPSARPLRTPAIDGRAALAAGYLDSNCMVDRIVTNCWALENLSNATKRCPTSGCGARTVRVTERGSDRRIIRSSTLILTQWQAGWDGSLDGTYRLNSYDAGRFNFGTAAGAAAFVDYLATGPSRYGDSFFSELVERVSGGALPQIPGERRLTTDEFAPILAEFNKMLTDKCKKFLDEIGASTSKLQGKRILIL